MKSKRSWPVPAVVYQGDLETIGVDVERQGVDRPGCGLRVEPPGEQDGEHSLTDAQRVQIGRSGGEGRPGDTGVTHPSVHSCFAAAELIFGIAAGLYVLTLLLVGLLPKHAQHTHG